jgi:DNA mismatch endonuclease (patch repair protein)
MTPEQRRKAMQSNRGRTQPELAVCKALWKLGFRYYTAKGYLTRTGVRLPGAPDLVLPRHKVAIFVDGCFWHGCKRCHDMDTWRSRWWQEKVEKTRGRDRSVRAKLRRMGWRVWAVWEHDLRRKQDFERSIARLSARLRRLDESSSDRRGS